MDRRAAAGGAVGAAPGGVVADDLGVELDVSGHVEVQVAVGVQVPEGGRGGPALHAGAPLRGRVLEPPVAPVQEEGVASLLGHVEVHVAVPVHVARGGAHGVPGEGLEPGPRAHVGERSRAVVAEEGVTVAGLGGPWGAGVGAALEEEEVEVPVAVHVEERPAAAHDLRQDPVTCGPGAVGEADAAGGRDVGEQLATFPCNLYFCAYSFPLIS